MLKAAICCCSLILGCFQLNACDAEGLHNHGSEIELCACGCGCKAPCDCGCLNGNPCQCKSNLN